MSNNNANKNNFPELRKSAEEKLSIRVKSKSAQAEIEHELNVHKIELEMQNEELLSIQQKLILSIKNYTELFEHAPIGYFVLDKSGIILNVNIYGSKQLGIDKNQLIGKFFTVFLNGESHQDNYYRHHNLVIEKNKILRLESECKKKDGSFSPVMIESSKVKDEKGHFKHLLSTMVDITEQKEIEHIAEKAFNQEKELGEMKSRFITMSSHEFRTPLATILSSLSLIDSYEKTEDVAKRNKHSEKIKFSVGELTNILSAFLAYSELDKELVKNEPKTFNLVRFIEDLISGTKIKKPAIVYKHIGKRQDVFLDSKLLFICLTNLLSNALKYSSKAETVEITSIINSSENITITIKDFGIGIAEAEKMHIFKQFFKTKNAETIQGIGMGLHIVQKIVGIMNGTIFFESELNKGTVFVLTLPNNSKN
ncbi:MAG: PAS domain-containing sensor histidine kinase [Bacteroidetes bacterium]|nr:PAS domain-containing sensor histidine kinase [Bacteroidota bacterium]